MCKVSSLAKTCEDYAGGAASLDTCPAHPGRELQSTLSSVPGSQLAHATVASIYNSFPTSCSHLSLGLRSWCEIGRVRPHWPSLKQRLCG